MKSINDGLFKSLADPTRRALFEALCREGEMSVHALTGGAGISQPAVSKHLALLRDAGLVEGRPAGRQTYYRARPETLAMLTDWAGQMMHFWESRADRLEDLLQRMDQ